MEVSTILSLKDGSAPWARAKFTIEKAPIKNNKINRGLGLIFRDKVLTKFADLGAFFVVLAF
ncbi:hypothetical protein A3B18_02870 [Candidatus Giovannonibacteria bacterium RIFCSPLOWO2_01_FULL_46_13]|uniref:Uncharacterized protein n=1 Tax=Candidatus Giovannonibacteria bacterium RIFCSPLOWO2_01_FULL_46_13 TaxID=1798352 RepID=A0A1F5X3V2_9BACT|nr:MAG: hypothetical protein A3B18_02870 [Candidatus Giovannonibacteria bacterium RIFCSPLOWO2_01_FULL_46_13]